jgi:hypothetical protein
LRLPCERQTQTQKNKDKHKLSYPYTKKETAEGPLSFFFSFKMTDNILEIGLNSYRDLSYAFSATVFGTNGGVPSSSMTCSTSGSESLEFFLDPSADHQCAGSDWVVVLIMVIMIHAVSWWGRWFVWEPIAEMRMSGIKKHFDPMTKTRFGMTLTSIFFHTTSAVFVYRLLTKTEWLWSTKDWSSNIAEKTIEADFKFYYLLYLSRYCSDSVSMFFEHRRKVRRRVAHLSNLQKSLQSVTLTHTHTRSPINTDTIRRLDSQDQFLQMLYHHIGA